MVAARTTSIEENLKHRAVTIRELLHKSQTMTDDVVSVLGTFDHRISALETAMLPTQVKVHAIRRANANIDKTVKAAEVILAQFDLIHKTETVIMKGPHEDLESYLEAIDQLRSCIHFFKGNEGYKSSDAVVNDANNLLAKAISKLGDEFRHILISYSKPVEPDQLFDCLPHSLRPTPGSPRDQDDGTSRSNNLNGLETSVCTPPTLIPPRVMPLLQDLAQQMLLAGHHHHQQLLRIYRDIRSSVLEQILRKLGVEEFSKDDVQKMQWEVLEAKIKDWILFVQIAVKLLYPGEKNICDQIFDKAGAFKDQCFVEVTANSVAVLFSLGDSLAKSKRSAEKLFVLLDIYEILRGIQPEIDTVFGSKACAEMQLYTYSLTNRLGQTALDTFGDFEDAVTRDATKIVEFDGRVHPLANYVMKYVEFLLDYKSTLKQLFQESDKGDRDSQFATVTTRILQALQNNLGMKSKQYRDVALTELFLMNNINYIVRAVRRSEVKDLLGEDWIQIHRRIVLQHATQYKRSSWTKILQCLSLQGLGLSGGSGSVGGEGRSSGVSRTTVKERLKAFSIQFEEIHQRQSRWIVPDSELRESLRLAVAEVLLPAYRFFLQRAGKMVEYGMNPQKYIKYTPEDIESMLTEFFEIKTASEQQR